MSLGFTNQPSSRSESRTMDRGSRIARRESPKGLGLRIMRYRADMIRGTLSIETPPQGGTQVTCILSENISNGSR